MVSRTPRSKSTTLLIAWSRAVRIRLLPPLPSTNRTWSPDRSTEGDIIEATRSAGGEAKNPSGWRSSSPIMLLSMIPVPGTTYPDPSPLEVVRLATFPQPSLTLTWVVPRSNRGTALPMRRRATSSITSTMRTACSAESAPALAGEVLSSSSNESAIRDPPTLGGGLVSSRCLR
jgi:hypothetical protein